MDRNFFLAFFLSTLVIIGYYLLYPPVPPPPQSETGRKTTRAESDQSVEPERDQTQSTFPAPLPPLAENADRKKITVETSLFTAEIDTQDGILRSFHLKDYQYAIEQHTSLKTIIVDFTVGLFTGKTKKRERPEIDPGRLVNLAGDLSNENRIWRFSVDPNQKALHYHVSDDFIDATNQSRSLTLQASLANGMEIYRTLQFHPDLYEIDLDIKVVNRTDRSQRIFPRFNFGAANEIVEFQPRPVPKMGIGYSDDSLEKYDDADEYTNPLRFHNVRWAGVMDTYFLTAVKMAGKDEMFFGELQGIDSMLAGEKVKIPKLAFAESNIEISANQEYQKRFRLFMGPKEHDLLEAFDKSLVFAMDVGWFDWLGQPILIVLRWIQRYVVNWGIAIILLTVVVRVAMLPLAYKGMISMAKMSDLGPEMKVLREKYKDNKERLNREIMAFYKKNKVNPVGGCFPMLLQIPIFIALYQALLPAIELRHSPFMLWIDDLSAADFTLALPLLMGLTMFLQQHLTPTPAMDPTQAKMMKWMPLMFVFFFLDMPSGLVLYWVVSNIISILQQMFFNKVKKKKGIGTQAKTPASKPTASGSRKRRKR